jgi:hypothetical protein
MDDGREAQRRLRVRELQRLRDEGRSWTERRDKAILRADEAGMSLREIGSAVGLSHAGVDKILKGLRGGGQ